VYFNHSTQNKNKFQENRFVLSRSTYRNVNLIDDDDDYILTSEKKNENEQKKLQDRDHRTIFSVH